MTLSTVDKGILITSCIIIAVVSVFGFIGGFIGMAVSGDNGWIALIVGSGVAFVGAIFLIFYASFKKKPSGERKVDKIKRPIKETFLWLGLTLVSGTGSVLTYFLGMKLYNGPITLMLILIAILAGVCLFSFFALVTGKRLRRKGVTEPEPFFDAEEKNDE